MAVGRRVTGGCPTLDGLPWEMARGPLQQFLGALEDSNNDGLPPDHAHEHIFDTGQDPLPEPTETPETVGLAGTSDIGDGTSPAREDHKHELDATVLAKLEDGEFLGLIGLRGLR